MREENTQRAVAQRSTRAPVSNIPEVVGSNPFPPDHFSLHFPKFIFNGPLGLDECPYGRRWVVDFGFLSFRLHKWLASDDTRAFHDHSWWFLTIVLWGSYTDVSPKGRDKLRMGSIRFRPATHKHTVEITTPGTWTFLITGRSIRRWGFWVAGKLLKRDKYFATFGHHPCSEGEEPVRIRPDKSRI